MEVRTYVHDLPEVPGLRFTKVYFKVLETERNRFYYRSFEPDRLWIMEYSHSKAYSDMREDQRVRQVFHGLEDRFNKLRRLIRDAKQAEVWVDWETRRKMTELTSTLDYDCQFDQNGNCKSYRNRRKYEPKVCCCGGCAHTVGHMNESFLDPESVEFVLENYDADLGFWRPGGCILPRKWRSSTCLEYMCGSTSAMKDLLRELSGYPGAQRYTPPRPGIRFFGDGKKFNIGIGHQVFTTQDSQVLRLLDPIRSGAKNMILPKGRDKTVRGITKNGDVVTFDARTVVFHE